MKKTERRTKRVASGSSSAPEVKNSSKARSGEDLNLDEIKELIEIIYEKQFNEFELERGSFRLRLQKGVNKESDELGRQAATDSAAVVEVGTRESAPITAIPQVSVAPAVAQAEEKLHIITSPIVGTYYRSPSPTSEPFVNLGDEVREGMTLCIIEAMKLMNEIQSDASGTIAKFFVENGQPVEYGQPLFGIKL
jgi:acetyl-CoA carboxylase biotin carboxyl carrier protein